MAFAPRTPIRPQNLSELVRAAIRAAIAAGEFQPGDRLTERSLAERLGVSAMPIRTALAALFDEGIAVREAHRGVPHSSIVANSMSSASRRGGHHVVVSFPVGAAGPNEHLLGCTLSHRNPMTLALQ